MYKVYKYYLIAFCFIIGLYISSCETTQNSSVASARFESNDTAMPLSRFADSILYIPLNTRGEILLSGNVRFDFSKHYILVEDKGTMQVLLFNREGQFIRKIGTSGRGPKEYTELKGAVIDEDAQRVFIGDNARKCLLVYDLEGEYKNDIKFDYYYGGFHILPGKRMLIFTTPSLYQEENAPNIHIVDYKGKDIHKKRLPLQYPGAKIQDVYFYKYMDRLCIIPRSSLKDSVFYLDAEYELVAHLVFEYEGKLDKKNIYEDSDYNSIPDKGISILGPIVELEHLVFAAGAVHDRKRRDFMYDKKQDIAYNLTSFEPDKVLRVGLMNDLDGGPQFMAYSQIDEKWAYGVLQPRHIHRFNQNKLLGDTIIQNMGAHSRLKDLANRVKEDDDPILQLVRFK